MSVQDDKKTKGSGANQDGSPPSLSRRKLLSNSMVAMPAILTLQSGAALARSSNLISASSPGTTDRHGRTLCVDSKSVYPASRRRRGVYDLGEPPHAVVNVISDRDYYVENPEEQDDENGHRDYRRRHGGDIARISEGEMCEKGGTYWFKPRHGQGVQSIQLPQNGFVISSGAASSFAADMTGKLI